MSRLSILLLLAAISLRARSAVLQPGMQAPPLSLSQVLQSGANTHVTWRELRGKTVVLEFWGTWCAPCIADLPHLNELVGTSDASKVTFISITDESPSVVQNFLAKRKMAGWIGIDRNGETFKRFGVRQRPTTIIVDRTGHVVAVTRPEVLTKEQILAASYAKPTIVSARVAPTPPVPVLSASNVIVGVSLSESKPDTPYSMSHSRDGSMQMLGATAEDLLTWVFNVKPDRLVWSGSVPKQTYDLHAALLHGQDNETFPLLRKTVELGLHIRAEVKTQEHSVLVLKASDRTKGLLTPTVTSSSMYGYWQGKVHMVNGSMDAFAEALETAFGQPVVNETGISGSYDLELAIPSGDPVEGGKVLCANFGLSLAREDRSIPLLFVTPVTEQP